jgi:hypothetical protein
VNPTTNKFEPLGPSTAKDLDHMFDLVRPDGTPVPKHWTQFAVGEQVVIKGYTFKVAYIGETAILFEPVGPVVVGATPP